MKMRLIGLFCVAVFLSHPIWAYTLPSPNPPAVFVDTDFYLDFPSNGTTHRVRTDCTGFENCTTDLQEAIRKRPQLFAQLIRELKEMPDHAVLRLVREVRDGGW